jgi:hypothetical protein
MWNSDRDHILWILWSASKHSKKYSSLPLDVIPFLHYQDNFWQFSRSACSSSSKCKERDRTRTWYVMLQSGVQQHRFRFEGFQKPFDALLPETICFITDKYSLQVLWSVPHDRSCWFFQGLEFAAHEEDGTLPYILHLLDLRGQGGRALQIEFFRPVRISSARVPTAFSVFTTRNTKEGHTINNMLSQPPTRRSMRDLIPAVTVNM